MCKCCQWNQSMGVSSKDGHHVCWQGCRGQAYRIDPNFLDQTLLLLSDIASAHSKPVPIISHPELQSQMPASLAMLPDYQFNLILTSVTISVALVASADSLYLSVFQSM